MRCLRMAAIPTAAVVPTIAISRTTRRAVLPAPIDTITAPRDLPTEESRFSPLGAFGEIFAVGAPYRDEVAISASLLPVLLFADLRATLVFSDSFAVVVFPTPTALGPPDVGTFSVYSSHAEPQLPVPDGDFDAVATAGATSAAARK